MIVEKKNRREQEQHGEGKIEAKKNKTNKQTKNMWENIIVW